jgi:hypothetical protein
MARKGISSEMPFLFVPTITAERFGPSSDYGRPALREAVALVEAGKKNSRVSTARDFYVRATCGHTSETLEEHQRRPVCNLAWEKFEVIRWREPTIADWLRPLPPCD